MSAEERRAFNAGLDRKLFKGGWICAGWPAEYGGKGLSLLQQVVLNEEFAKANAPMRADFFGDTLVGPTILQWGTDEQKKEFIPGHPAGQDRVVPGVLRTQLRLGPRESQDQRGARRRRVGHQRPEGLDHPGPTRRLRLLAGAHRPRRAPARGHQLPARAHAPSRASRCARSPRSTVRPSSTRSSSPTRAARRTTSSAASTTAGRSP
jgi:hypothetical protein